MKALRVPIALAGAILFSLAKADRLINIPTGTKVYINTLKIDGQWVRSNTRGNRYGIRAPLGQSMDIEVDGSQYRLKGDRLRVHASYQLIVPLIDIAPGVSVGIRDITNAGTDGRAAYLALTYKFGQEGYYNQDTPVELTVGVGTGGIRGPFSGVMLPFADFFRLIAEYDSRRLTAGLEIRPLRDLSVQWLFREKETRLHLTWLVRW